jgi:hypothetical protein
MREYFTICHVSDHGDWLYVTGTPGHVFKKGDIYQFSDDVHGYPDLRFLSLQGCETTQRVRIKILEDCIVDSGASARNLKITPSLICDPDDELSNINHPITAGMQIIKVK